MECSLVEEEECRTITEELCEEAQYLTVLDSYGNEVGTGTSGQNIDSYGAPLAPPLKEEGEPRPPDSLYMYLHLFHYNYIGKCLDFSPVKTLNEINSRGFMSGG